MRTRKSESCPTGSHDVRRDLSNIPTCQSVEQGRFMAEAAHESRLMHSRWKDSLPRRHSPDGTLQVPSNKLCPAEAGKDLGNGPLKSRCRNKHTIARHERQAAARKGVWARVFSCHVTGSKHKIYLIKRHQCSWKHTTRDYSVQPVSWNYLIYRRPTFLFREEVSLGSYFQNFFCSTWSMSAI